jgi:cytochrome P450 family 135
MPLPPGPPFPLPMQTTLWLRRPTELLASCRRRYGTTFTLRLPKLALLLLI